MDQPIATPTTPVFDQPIATPTAGAMPSPTYIPESPKAASGTDTGPNPMNVLLQRLAQIQAKGRPKPTPGAFGGKNRVTGKQGWKRRPGS